MKMANGSGSIVRLGGSRRKPYAVRITQGWKDGKQVRKYLGYYATQSEAIAALAEYHQLGYDVDMNKLTLYEVFDKWLARIEAKNLTESVVKTHIMARKRFGQLGNKQLKTIKPDQLQDWLDGLDLKPASKGKVRNTLCRLYDYAVINDIVSKNYAKGLEINEKVEKTGRIFSDAEIETLWKHSDEDQIQDILILIYTGLRIGELLSITTDDLHLEEGYMIGGSKTEAGRNRVIPIHDRIRPFIGSKVAESRYIVHSKRGTSIDYPAAKHRFKRLMERFGWEHRLHDTRKTAISIMHSAGIPMETVRIIVGHAGVGVTERIYLHKHPSELVKVINTVDIPY